MAVSKSISRKSATKKAAKTRKSRAAAKKVSKTRKGRAAGKKAAATPKTKATVDTVLEQGHRSETLPTLAEIDNQIAIVRDNLRQLVERAASSSGASDEELISQRIAEQEARLALLRKKREEVTR